VLLMLPPIIIRDHSKNIADQKAINGGTMAAIRRGMTMVTWVISAQSFTPNAWGLCNMFGNVAEWTDSPYAPLPKISVTEEAAGQIQ
jgi:hypothetical protein